MNQMILIFERHRQIVLSGGTIPVWKRRVLGSFRQMSRDEWLDMLKDWNGVQREMMVLYRREKYGTERGRKWKRNDWVNPAWGLRRMS